MVPYITPKENKRFVMGGTGSLENVDVLDDIWALSLEKVNDTASNEIPGAFWTKVEYQNTNNQFIPVKNFTTNVISPEEVLIFGGFTSNTTATNNCYLFNMKDHRMRLVETKGIKPSARGSHVTLKSSRNPTNSSPISSLCTEGNQSLPRSLF